MPRQKRKIFEATSQQLDRFPREKRGSINAFIPKVDELVNAEVSHQLLTKQAEEIIGFLSPVERKVLQMGFGLLDGKSRTAEDIAIELGIPLEEVNKIEKNSLQKLKSPIRVQKSSETLKA